MALFKARSAEVSGFLILMMGFRVFNDILHPVKGHDAALLRKNAEVKGALYVVVDPPVTPIRRDLVQGLLPVPSFSDRLKDWGYRGPRLALIVSFKSVHV